MESAHSLEECNTKITNFRAIFLESASSPKSYGFHAPQTLDRSYYLGLKDTSDRDSDQVLYKYTNRENPQDRSSQSVSQTQQPMAEVGPMELEALAKAGKGPTSFAPTISGLESVSGQGIATAEGPQDNDTIALDASDARKNQHEITGDPQKNLEATNQGEEQNPGGEKNQEKKQIQEGNHSHADHSRLLMVPQLWLWKIDHRIYLIHYYSPFL